MSSEPTTDLPPVRLIHRTHHYRSLCSVSGCHHDYATGGFEVTDAAYLEHMRAAHSAMLLPKDRAP